MDLHDLEHDAIRDRGHVAQDRPLDVATAVTNGHLVRAVFAFDALDDRGRGRALELLTLARHGDRYADEVRLLGLCARDRSIVKRLRTARGVSLGASALTATLLAFVMGFLAAIPALAMLYVAGEAARIVVFHTKLRRLSSDDARVLQGLLDVSLYRSDDTLVTEVGGVCFALVGAFVVVLGSAMRGTGEWYAAPAIVAVGVMFVIAGAEAARAARRMKRTQVFASSVGARVREEWSSTRDPRSDRTFATLCIVLVGFCGTVATLVLLLMVFGDSRPTVDPTTLPAGRAYFVTVLPNGQTGNAHITCPSAFSSLFRADDVCAELVRSNLRTLGFVLLVDLVFLVVQLLLVRWRRRLTAVLRRPPPPDNGRVAPGNLLGPPASMG